ncbi:MULTISPECIES: tripartite tricarboxylate transporter substrate-binding protein [unclassified Acidovorax]|uniref:tripartite tricarboxylate transporter substrate-binding protein n=1 Tax=unclassified Acidovorax TaxID=2684926 RepID=UPI001C455D2E|nr:tripartite tricarboxylate transporter substrate binding protein BugD [Acidovorax sp. sif0732]MBV7448479.1 tripartite tricarboxylate transporter substrate binding protein BugD [Acidovorax sp. sif0715]
MNFNIPCTAAIAGAVLASLACAMPAWSQAYPAKPITLVVPFSAGGPTDVVARLLAAAMGKTLGQTVLVENKTGAGGTISATYTARATPDGYTFLIHHNGMATAPALYRKLSYKPLADFDYVSQVVDVPMTLVGRKDLPAKDFKELQAWSKAQGDKTNLAHAGLGAVSHLCGVLLRQAMGVEMTTVPFQGTGPAMNALLAGQVDLLCDQTTSTTPFIKAGSVKLYGVTTPSRLKTLPETPTLQEQGLKGFQIVVWHGIYAPKGTPKEAIDKFGAALRTALKDPAVVQRLTDLGAVIPSEEKLNPEGLRTWLDQETQRYAPVIKAAGQFAD